MIRKASQEKKGKGRGIPGFQVIEEECVWMKAGVVNFHLCDNHYDCLHCAFDQSMRRALDAQSAPKGNGTVTDWAKEMRKKYPGPSKPCRYFLTGQIGPPGQCARDYDCDGCPIDMELGYEPLRRHIEVERYAQELTRKDREKIGPAVSQEEQCVWMKAGIINFRHCDQEYDCYRCGFDRSMRQAMGEGMLSQEVRDALLWTRQLETQYHIVPAPCIHALTGRVDPSTRCDHPGQCHHCDIHQRLMAEKPVQPVSEPHYVPVAGCRMADGYYYHFGHTWARMEEEGNVKIGLDEFAAKLFGRPKKMELPPPGAALKQGEVGWLMIRNGHRAAIRSPLSGNVLAVNTEAAERPEIIHGDPYETGWLFTLKPLALQDELQGLYFGSEGVEWMENETRALLNALGPGYERLASTGGRLVDDLFGQVPGIDWDRLVEDFLHTGEKTVSI